MTNCCYSDVWKRVEILTKFILAIHVSSGMRITVRGRMCCVIHQMTVCARILELCEAALD